MEAEVAVPACRGRIRLRTGSPSLGLGLVLLDRSCAPVCRLLRTLGDPNRGDDLLRPCSSGRTALHGDGEAIPDATTCEPTALRRALVPGATRAVESWVES